MKRKPLVYIAGPCRGGDGKPCVMNISKASNLRDKLILMGYSVICPHTLFISSVISEPKILSTCIDIMSRCDLVVLVTELYHDSFGTNKELEVADKLGIPILLPNHVPDAIEFAKTK